VCAASSALEHDLDDFTLHRCSNCGHCFTDLASVDELERYEPDYFEREHRNWFLHPNLALYAKLSRVIVGHKFDGSVLDIGCGNGNSLRYLAAQSKSLSLTGIDMAPNAPTDGITYLQGDFLGERFEQRLDVLVSLAVIEHIPDVTAFARRMSEICEPGGTVITMTVDERGLVYGAARTLNRAGYSTPLRRLYSKHHLNHFTSRSLRELLERQSLATVRVIRHNSPMAAVDIPETSILSGLSQKAGVWGAFQLGLLTRRTMLQTVISQKLRS
jgi:2-polyprenyl-3-methyl-5-hydroxy-6-metoxy-1,4-benzoquinol methylase